MPVIPYSPPNDGGFATSLTKLSQQQRDALIYGREFSEEVHKAPVKPGFIETLGAQAGTTLVGSLAYAANRPTREDGPEDFNPYKFIRENEGLANDPLMPSMVERGVFDSSYSEKQFWYDYHAASQFLNDIDTISRASTAVKASTWVAAMAGDPTNLIPLGLGTAAVRTGGALARAVKAGAVVGSAGLAMKKAQDALTPISNEPGLTDEAVTLGFGTLIGAGLSVFTSPALGGAYLSPAKKKQLIEDLTALQNGTFDSAVRQAMAEKSTLDINGQRVVTKGAVTTPDGTEVVQPTGKVATPPPAPPPASPPPVVVTPVEAATPDSPAAAATVAPEPAVEAQVAPPADAGGAPALPKPVAQPKGSRAQPFSRADLERRLKDARDNGLVGIAMDGDVERAMAELEWSDGSGFFSFAGKLPTEIEEWLQKFDDRGGKLSKRERLRSMFRTNATTGVVHGQDYFEMIPWDTYQRILDDFASGAIEKGRYGRIAQAIIDNDPDPGRQFLAYVYRNMPEGRTPRKEVYEPGSVPVGSTFELNGERFYVVEHEDGYRVLKDGDFYPEVPLEALDQLPVDKGTMRMADPDEVPDFAADVSADEATFNQIFGITDEAVSNAEAIWGKTADEVQGRGSPTPPPDDGGKVASLKPDGEPWQMSRADFVAQREAESMAESQRLDYIEEQLAGGKSAEEIAQELGEPVRDVKRTIDSIENPGDELADIDTFTPAEAHRDIVARAIREGKISSHPDYPDLRPEGGKVASEQSRDLFGAPTTEKLSGKQGEMVFETERKPAPDTSGRDDKEKAVGDRIDKYTPQIFGQGPAGAMGAAARADITPAKVTLADEYNLGLQWLVRLLKSDPVPNRVVSVLNRPGDVARQMLDQLRAKYDEAGTQLHVVDHPNQYHYDLEQDMAALLNSDGMNVEAAPADFDYGWGTKAMSSIARRYARLQSVVNPGGRLQNQMLGRIHDIIRTLSGSVQTVSTGSARNSFGFKSGVSAEGFKGALEGPKDAAVWKLRKVYSLIRKDGKPIEFNGVTITGRFDYDKFRRAVHDYYRMKSAEEAGFIIDIPPVPKAIELGADALRPYFHGMRNQGVKSGLLPQAVSKRRWYLPRTWDTEQIMARSKEFDERLTRAFRKRDLHAGGKSVSPDEIPLKPEVAEKMDQNVLLKLVGEKTGQQAQLDLTGPGMGNKPQPKLTPEMIEKLTEGDLPRDVARAYEAELEAFYRRNAQLVRERLTGSDDASGVVDALDVRSKNDPAKARVMDIDDAELADFLVGDVETLLERYHHVMAGRIAVARAIQLNPYVWADVTLKDGTPITNGTTMKAYLRETADTLIKFAQFQDERAGTPGKLTAKAEKMRHRLLKDIGDPLDMLEGRDPLGTQDRFGLWRWSGRSLLKLSYLNKLGGMFWASLNDMAPLTMFAVQRPQTLAMFPKVIMGLKGYSRREMEAFGLGFDHTTRARAVFDTDALYGKLGGGDGIVRTATGKIEAGLDKLVDIQGAATMMHFWTRTLQQQGGIMVLDRLGEHSKRLIRAQELIDKGVPKAKALRDVGLNAYDAARVNKLGLDVERAKVYHDQVYKHGLLPNDTPVKDAMSFDEYMKSSRLVKPNIAEWDAQADDLRDILMGNVHAEVTRHLVVQPGVFDRPLVNMKVSGKLLNQFQTFGMAFVNQRLRPMAQMPAKYQMWYYMNYMMMGAVADAISNHLAGRRSLDETAKLWKDNPLGMFYAAFDRSGMAGWWGRPLAISDALGMPYSPGALVGRIPESTTSRHIQTGRALTLFGPAASDVDSMIALAGDTASGRVNQAVAYKAWKLMPFQNNMWLRLLYRTTGAPVVPEAIKPTPRRNLFEEPVP